MNKVTQKTEHRSLWRRLLCFIGVHSHAWCYKSKKSLLYFVCPSCKHRWSVDTDW